MTLLRCMQVMRYCSELTNLASYSLAGPDRLQIAARDAVHADHRVLVYECTSYPSSFATACNNGGNPERSSLSVIQAGSLPRFELKCSLNEITAGGHVRK